MPGERLVDENQQNVCDVNVNVVGDRPLTVEKAIDPKCEEHRQTLRELVRHDGRECCSKAWGGGGKDDYICNVIYVGQWHLRA